MASCRTTRRGVLVQVCTAHCGSTCPTHPPGRSLRLLRPASGVRGADVAVPMPGPISGVLEGHPPGPTFRLSGQCQATVTRSSTRDLLFGCRVAAFTDKKKKTNTNTRYCSLASSPSSSTTASWPQLQRRSRSHPHSASTTLFPPLSPPLPRGLALLVRIVTARGLLFGCRGRVEGSSVLRFNR